jgi:hypothetical protein
MDWIKKIFAAITLVVVLSFYGISQPCNQEELFRIPGEWKAGLKGSTMNVSKENLVKETQTVQSILEIFKSGYSPMGCRVSYSGVYGFNPNSGKNWIANPYGLSMFFLRYLCEHDNSGKYYVDVSTPTSLDVSVNKFQLERIELYAAELPEHHEIGYITIVGLPEYKDGYYYFEEQADYHKDIKTYTWIIGYEGKLPYKFVTVREYLNLKKAEFESKLAENNNREQARKNRGDEFTEDDIDFYNRQREYYGKPIQLIDEMLQTKSEAELESPAAILGTGDLQTLQPLVNLNTPGADIFIKPNPDYYKKNLPKHVPQLISINLKVQHGDPVFEDVYEKISKAIDIKKFKAMIGETYPLSHQ